MSVSESNRTEFAALVEKYFAFLVSEAGLLLTGVTCVDEGPRDSYVVAKYRGEAHRVDVAWAPVEMSLSVLVRTETEGLARREQYVYAEPFIEFISQGKVAPVIPQIYPGMSVSSIQRTMKSRAEIFAGGLLGAMEILSSRLKTFYPAIQDASVETIRAYHNWFRERGKCV